MSDLSALRPQEAPSVDLGGVKFLITTPTLDQWDQIGDSVASMANLGNLLAKIPQLFKESEGEEVSSWDRIAIDGPALWESARTVVGKEFFPAVRSAVLALLDTRQNEALYVASLSNADEQGAVLDSVVKAEGYRMRNTALRIFIRENLTLADASAVVHAALASAELGTVVGNLMPPAPKQTADQ